jgi:acyl-CoA hydrolase
VSDTGVGSLGAAVSTILARCGPSLVAAAPLGLGKPHRLLNALYDAVVGDPSRSLQLYTALSLTPPRVGGDGLEARFLGPFVERHFGADFPVLAYARAQRGDSLPGNVKVEEFYLQSGALLSSHQAQQSHSSLNYTHVARAVAARRPNLLVQKVARDAAGRISLSCNPDLTFDLLDEVALRGFPRPMMVAEVDPNLPFIGGSALAPPDYFDLVLDIPGPAPALFALPRQPVSDADYAIGLRASALVRDGGTLQIGIGSLADALCHALILRHRDNAAYLRALAALDPALAGSAVVRECGGTAPFAQGLYGASEMVNDGFRALHQAGILRRRVLDDIAAMQRINAGTPSDDDRARLASEGRWLDGGFYLGSTDLYAWLRDLPPGEREGLGMTRISHINELYGGNESLERLQRRDARFFNTCMMGTLLGDAVSDALEDGRVVSGVGGQYNFVAMAHALRDGRSVLMFRASRQEGARLRSSVLWNYGHVTIPRHLRDVMVTEYGVADLRGASDAECVERMLSLADAGFAPALRATATAAGKLPPALPADINGSPRHSAASLAAALRPFRRDGTLPDYPLGSDFTAVEQRLAKALGWLKQATASPAGKLRTLAAALLRGGAVDADALARMGLARPATLRNRLDSRLLGLALARTAADAH